MPYDEDEEYDRRRDAVLTAPDARAREVGRAVAEVIGRAYGSRVDLALDSGVVQEELGDRLVDELRRNGLRVVPA